jgi:hypothetical protein
MPHISNYDVCVTVLSRREDHLSALRTLTEWADDLYLAYAWASSNLGRSAHWLALPLEKIRMALIGVHFAQTEPWLLERLHNQSGILRVVEDTAGIYHPKLIVGIRNRDARALVGSSNFTQGGFAANSELNVLIEGPRASKVISQLIEFVENEWQGPRSFVPDADWFLRYREAYDRRPRPPRIASPLGQIPVVAKLRDLDVAWPDYYELIKAQERRTMANAAEIHVFDHDDGSYLQEAERCRHAFEQYASFARMPISARRLVAGLPPESSGYFGRMVGAGYFKQLVRLTPELLSEPLDGIPLRGTIERAQVEHCLKRLTALRGLSIATATRLLCMKRQDRFLPLNDANRRRIRELFGAVQNTVRGYADLQDRIAAFEWMHALEPLDVNERRVWHARAALLDALLYEATPESGPPGFAPKPAPSAPPQDFGGRLGE